MSKPETIIETYLRELFDANDPELSSAPDGVGFKAHIGDLFNREDEDGNVERLFIQLYAQSVIPTKPADTDLGYVPEDIIYEHGIVMADVASRTDPPSYIGEIIPEEEFVAEFLVDSPIEFKFTSMMEKLKDMVVPQESWMEQVSSLYNDRLPGNEGIIKKRSIC